MWHHIFWSYLCMTTFIPELGINAFCCLRLARCARLWLSWVQDQPQWATMTITTLQVSNFTSRSTCTQTLVWKDLPLHSFSHCELLVHQPGAHSAHCHHAYLSPEGPRFAVSCGINRINTVPHFNVLVVRFLRLERFLRAGGAPPFQNLSDTTISHAHHGGPKISSPHGSHSWSGGRCASRTSAVRTQKWHKSNVFFQRKISKYAEKMSLTL